MTKNKEKACVRLFHIDGQSVLSKPVVPGLGDSQLPIPPEKLIAIKTRTGLLDQNEVS
jgi:hypothetical protein